MANHKSSIKRIRQTLSRRLANRYYARTARNVVRDLRATTDKTQADELYKKTSAMLDKLAKKNVIHANKAANLKSKLAHRIGKLAVA
ncbi:SSU ribosomal protein S20p [Candidatus Symbiothrix dinenymphae]|nr:SSU ribosomal protein S20p [Candidatus Symbiothrix dinenymphae]